MKTLFFLLTLVFAFQAHALNLIGYRFTDSYRYATLDDSLQEKFPGKYVLTASGSYIKSPFYVTDSNVSRKNSDIISYAYVATFGFSYYVSDKLSVGVDLNGVHNKVFGEEHTTFGDSVLKARWNLLRTDAFSFSLNPQVFVPTGSGESFSTIGSFGGSLSAVGEYAVNRWHLLASAGYFSARNNNYRIVDYRDLVLTQLGLSYDLNSNWNANVEANRAFTTNSDYKQDEGDYYLTMKNRTTNNLSTYFGAGLAGIDEVDRHNYTLFAGLKFSEAPLPEPLKPVVAEAPVKKPKPVIKSRADEALLGSLMKAENIYFDNNKWNLNDKEQNKLLDLVNSYKQIGEQINHIVIEGYASRVGNTVHNKILGTKRAEEVKAFLEKNGIPEEKLSYVSYGDSTPQEKEEWMNRKVQFRVYKN